MIIYKTTNLINGKFYIGKHNSSDDCYLGSGAILKNAIKKYGRHNFIRETIEECLDDNVDEREIYWIAKLNAIEYGYNLTNGGEGGDTISGHPNKEQICRKMSKNHKGQQAWNKGIHHTEEHKRKISDAVSGEKNPFYGKIHSNESRKKIGEKSKDRIPSEETRRKMSEAGRGVKKSEEHKTKMSEAAKKLWQRRKENAQASI